MDEELTAEVDRLRWDKRRHPGRGQREYATTARTVREVCDQLTATGHADQAVPVLRKAVDRITRTLMYLDDSSGIIGVELRQIMRSYARACTVAPPAPKSLATWLVKLQCDGPGWPDIVLPDFAAALGPKGVAEIERQVTERATTVDPDSWSADFHLRDLREQLAEISGDVDRYVAVLAERLTNPGPYEKIATALHAAGRHAEALDWARRGVSDHVTSPYTDSLRDVLVDLLLDADDHAGALQVRQSEFDRRPISATYWPWAQTAARVGAPDPLPDALTVLRERTATQPKYAAELVALLLVGGQDDDAWRIATAHREYLGEQLWLDVLNRRSATHPGNVLEPYRDLIEQHVLDSSDKQRYRRAVTLLPPLQRAHRADGQPEAFTPYLAELRQRHLRRPSFLKTLDSRGF